MKIIAVVSAILVGALVSLTDAHCGNTDPVVEGFGNVQPFSRPPDTDSCILICVRYETNEDISFESYDENGDKFDKKFKATDHYSGADLTSFTNMCEDLWILNDFIAQEAATSGNYNYESKGLCFDTPNPGFAYDPDLNSGRAQFIIDTCHGSDPCAESDAPTPCDSTDERLVRLSETVETTAAYAEDRARRQTFDTGAALAGQLEEAEALWDLSEGDPDDLCDKPTNSNCDNNALICRELKTCYEQQFGDGGLFGDLLDGTDIGVGDFINDSFMYEQCFNVTLADLTSNKDGVCSDTTADSGCSPYDITDGVGLCGEGGGGNPTEPVCPSDVAPWFATFPPAYPNPNDNPSYGAAVLTIQDLFLCKAGGQIDYTDRTSADAVGITLIVKFAFEGMKIAAELFKDSLPHWELYIFKIFPYQIIAVLDHGVDTVLEQAGLHDGLVDGAEMEAIYENTLQLLKGSQAIYDEVVCRCTSDEQTEPLRGQGCDSIDNNCDDFVDDCAEDTFKPEIDISAASLNCASGNGQTNWFTTDQEALDCVNTYASVADDCDTTVTFDSVTLSAETCGDAFITLEASDRCGNPADTKVVPVFIDKSAPTVLCSVGPNAEKTIKVEDTGAGVMTDVELLYDATDNCGFDLDVSVNVYANEIEDFHNQETAILFRDGLSHNKVNLYVAAQYCPTDANGQCIKDPVVDRRIYTIVISATDEAGNVAAVDECKVVILKKNEDLDDFAIDSSTQRFHLDSYSSTFSGYTITV